MSIQVRVYLVNPFCPLHDSLTKIINSPKTRFVVYLHTAVSTQKETHFFACLSHLPPYTSTLPKRPANY
jgi:hypothetical protein